MNKQTLFGTFLAAALMCGCQSSKVKVSGRFVGNDAREVYLEQLAPLSPSIVDSTRLAEDGSYEFRLKEVPPTPVLYNIIYNVVTAL